MSTKVEVGKPVRIDAQEARLLREYAQAMHVAAVKQTPGWFEEFCRLHKQSHRVIRQVINRAWGIGA